jgi:hypothetical protein
MTFSAFPIALCAALASASLLGQIVHVTPETRIPYGHGKGARVVLQEEKVIEEKTLEFDANISAPPDPGGDKANGACFYAFVLAPKEQLTVKLKGEDANHLGMIACRPAVADKMTSQFERSERVPKALRSSRFEMQNITSEPYTVVVMVYGTVNHWFKLTVERKL